jgi:AcrR family transcriptional regulator
MDRRQALVAAATACIAEKGFEGLRLREVAAEVGINHATLHHYFPTKEHLIAAVVEETTRQFHTSMPDADGAAARLAGHLAVLARLMLERPGLVRVLRELDLRAARDPAIRAMIDRAQEGWVESLAAMFHRGQEEDAWARPLDPERAAELVIATVKGASLHLPTAGNVLADLERLLVGPAVRSTRHR